MRRSVLTFMAGLAVHAVAASVASACPACDTGTGEQVRAGIFDEDFGRTVVAVLLPFPILLGLVAVIHFGWPRPRPPGQPGQSDGSGDPPGRINDDD